MQVRNLIHKKNPYDNFKNEVVLNLTGGGSLDDINVKNWFTSFILKEIKPSNPSLFIEVGSLFGQSANVLASISKKYLNNSLEILCVDTWCGSTTHWEWLSNNTIDILNLRNGFPNLYNQFLSNIISHNNQDIITPFPCSSVDAACFLNSKGIKADFIFIDASHEELCVLNDLRYYWNILKVGGWLMIDDYNNAFPGVIKAASTFFNFNRENLKEIPFDKFLLIQKQ